MPPVDFSGHNRHIRIMSTAFQPKPRIIGHKVRVCIVASKYNEEFTDELVKNAIEELDQLFPQGRLDVVRVPGAFEVPVTVSSLLEREKPNCVIALGLLIQGDTAHADLVAESVTNSLQSIAVEQRCPIIHEILLVKDEKQAYARCIGSKMNRGREAARAAASMVDVFQELNRTMPLKASGPRKSRYA